MKTASISLMVIRFAACALLTMFLAGCSHVEGTYVCEGGLLDSVKLDSGKAYLTATMFGMKQEHAGTYTTDGDKVNVMVNGQSTVFTLNNKTLDGGEMVGKCTMK